MKDDNIEKREVIERYFKTMGLPGMARQAKHSQSASEIKEWEDFIVISERLRNRKNQKLSDHEVKPKNKKKIPDIQSLLKRYQTDLSGIHNEVRMRYICIVCGSVDVRDKSSEEPYYKICQHCNNIWYINYCWNCANGWVDSRDPETPQCLSCGWYKCQVCGACNKLGCFTNPYSQNNRLQDLKKAGFDYTLTREEKVLLDQYYEF